VSYTSFHFNLPVSFVCFAFTRNRGVLLVQVYGYLTTKFIIKIYLCLQITSVKLIVNKYLPKYIDIFTCNFHVCFTSSDAICVLNRKLCEADRFLLSLIQY